MIIVGITWTLGAGKGTIVDYLVHKKGFQHFSVRAYLIQKIEERGLPINRDSMVIVGNDLRAKHTPAYIGEQLYKQAAASSQNTIIESIRTVGEVESLRNKGNFYLFAIDADTKIRYERILLRASESDHVSYQKFLDDEQKEMQNTDPNKQNVAQCIQLADYVFTNNGTIEELHTQIDAAITSLKI